MNTSKSLLQSSIGRFRLVAIAEGVSYLILLFIAMPLKYFAGIRYAVNYIGWIHGLLFILYGFLLLNVWMKYHWKFAKAALVFIAALVPFGTFIVDRKLKKEYF